MESVRINKLFARWNTGASIKKTKVREQHEVLTLFMREQKVFKDLFRTAAPNSANELTAGFAEAVGVRASLKQNESEIEVPEDVIEAMDAIRIALFTEIGASLAAKKNSPLKRPAES
jgi:hypothetical protein